MDRIRLTDTLTLNGRVELWRDDNNFFVASFSGNNDPVRFQQGLRRWPVYGGQGFYGPAATGARQHAPTAL